jgi:glycosyltransferase involved in cell wall biosynthesis
MIFEHAFRLKANGFRVSITFKYFDASIPTSAFPHAVETNIIKYGSETKFDLVIATYWATVYDLKDFSARFYLYFCQCDERLFYEENDSRRFWVEQTYSVVALFKIASAKFLAEKLNIEFSGPAFHAPCGINLDKFNQSNKPVKSGRVKVLIEGPGKAKFKRIDDAFKVVRKFPDIEVWYVTYDGYVSPDWKPDRVFVKVPHHEMPDIYQSCDILLKLSAVESFGLPNLEMMACGGAVITSAFTGQEEYAIDGENAFVVDIGDTDKAAERLSQLINDSELRRRFGENGVKTASKRDWNTLKPSFADVLNRIVTEYPQGNRESCLPRLENLSLGYKEWESLLNGRDYMNKWKQSIVERESTLTYRIANKLHHFLNSSEK